MYESNNRNNWLKHWDFMLIDVLGMIVSIAFAYWAKVGSLSIWNDEIYLEIIVVIALLTLLCGQLSNTYRDILKRDTNEEVKRVLILTCLVFILTVGLLFVIKESASYSRQIIGTAWLISSVLLTLLHIVHKKFLNYNLRNSDKRRKLFLICCVKDKADIARYFTDAMHNAEEFVGISLLDAEDSEGMPEVCMTAVKKEDIQQYLSRNAVDGVMISRRAAKIIDESIVEDCIDMGIPVHRILYREYMPYGVNTVENVAGYTVITSSIKMATPRQLLTKRAIDILGGIVGSVMAVIIIVLTAPIILIQSPGPILFKQERMGKNGRVFTIYKLRTMYTDAEERKAELMKDNKMDGPIFKIDDDPRIYPFGHFLRRTSLDEFPQFFNVVKGDMSIVGTRPPTVGEYNMYEYHHKKRLAIKPGITGLWQVSGRNEITDFEEIVKLDTEYIMNWHLMSDMTIILKTIGVLFSRKGAQ